jgi:D-arabinose 1-dehydrogenase-like Zn-dependent alcohol dehydrogenase
VRALQLIGWQKEPEFRDVAEPEPGPGEVVIRVAGAGACHSDRHLMHDFDEGMVSPTDVQRAIDLAALRTPKPSLAMPNKEPS